MTSKLIHEIRDRIFKAIGSSAAMLDVEWRKRGNLIIDELLEEIYESGKQEVIDSLEAIENVVSTDECADIEYKLAMDRFDSPTEKSMAKILGQIYKIAHSNNPNNSCYNVHQNWRDEMMSPKNKSDNQEL